MLSLRVATNVIDPVLLPAIFGLVGVVIGALLTAGSTYLLEIRREEREMAKEDRDRAEELRKAARLVQFDLSSGVVALERSIEGGQFYRLSHDALTENSWPGVKTIFASALSTQQWNALTLGIRMLASFKGVRDLAMASADRQISEEGERTLKELLDSVRAAQEVLDSLV
jgi:hypothetical protein